MSFTAPSSTVPSALEAQICQTQSIPLKHNKFVFSRIYLEKKNRLTFFFLIKHDTMTNKLLSAGDEPRTKQKQQ